MSNPIRLDRHLAAQLACSRGDAQRYIEGGWVTVEGRVVEEPQAPVAAGQHVELHPQARLEAIEPATLLLHKPTGIDARAAVALAVPAHRAVDDPSATRMLQRHFHGLEPLMPLEAEASGLLVLSQDPRVRRRLLEDHRLIEQEFLVEVAGATGPYTLARLSQGLAYRGRPLPRCKVSWQNEVRLRFAIKDVQPGQLRDMCAQVGLEAVAVRRLRIGRIPLAKLPVGQWRYLPVGERF